MRLNRDRSFFENRRNCSPSELHGGSLFRTFNSYSFNFNGGLRKRRTGFCLLRTPSPRGKHFLWFWNLTSCDFFAFISSFIEVNFFFFLDVLIKDKFTLSVSKYNSFWCFGFQWVTLWRSDKFLLTLSVFCVNGSNPFFERNSLFLFQTWLILVLYQTFTFGITW